VGTKARDERLIRDAHTLGRNRGNLTGKGEFANEKYKKAGRGKKTLKNGGYFHGRRKRHSNAGQKTTGESKFHRKRKKKSGGGLAKARLPGQRGETAGGNIETTRAQKKSIR